MAIDVFSEDVMKLAEAGRKVPGSVSPATLYRWANRGIEGERLETINVGGVTMTSTKALQQFFERVTAAKESKAQAELDALCDDVDRSDRTTRKLEAAGLI